VSAGETYTEALGGAYQYAHGYSFDVGSTQGGSYAVTVYDRAGNHADAGFTVTRDPSLCSGRGVTAPVEGMKLLAGAHKCRRGGILQGLRRWFDATQ
jgi:hypothetical protein